MCAIEIFPVSLHSQTCRVIVLTFSLTYCIFRITMKLDQSHSLTWCTVRLTTQLCFLNNQTFYIVGLTTQLNLIFSQTYYANVLTMKLDLLHIQTHCQFRLSSFLDSCQHESIELVLLYRVNQNYSIKLESHYRVNTTLQSYCYSIELVFICRCIVTLLTQH